MYTIIPSVFDTDNSFIEGFRVGHEGQLTLVAETAHSLPIDISGLAR